MNSTNFPKNFFTRLNNFLRGRREDSQQLSNSRLNNFYTTWLIAKLAEVGPLSRWQMLSQSCEPGALAVPGLHIVKLNNLTVDKSTTRRSWKIDQVNNFYAGILEKLNNFS